MATVYRKHSLTAGRIVDGLAFVVTAENNKLHTLNPTASHLWTLCQDGLTVEDAAQSLHQTFDVELDVARTDAEACLDDLVKRDILAIDLTTKP